MRKIAGLLFAVGIPWSLIAWIAIFGGPAEAIEDLATALHHRDRLPGAIAQIPVMLLLSANAALGYWIWSRWLLIAVGERAASRRFWYLAAAHHLTWALCWFPMNGGFNPICLYSALVFDTCIFAAASTSGRDLKAGKNRCQFIFSAG